MTAIEPGDGGVRLRTERGDFHVEHVVLCAGAWTRGLLRALGLDWPIRLTQEQVTYYATPNLAAFAPERFPIWLWHGDGDDEYYGFPVHGEVATKAAQDLGRPGDERRGLAVAARPRAGRAGGAVLRDDPARLHRARAIHAVLPLRHAAGPRLRRRPLPGFPSLSVCIGAGHAAKFAGLLGRILAELAIDGRTAFPIEAFRADRPALADPAFRAGYRLGGVGEPGAAL